MWRRVRFAGWLTAGVIVLGVGWSRVYLGMHWTTDVVAGWLMRGLADAPYSGRDQPVAWPKSPRQTERPAASERRIGLILRVAAAWCGDLAGRPADQRMQFPPLVQPVLADDAPHGDHLTLAWQAT